MLGAATRSRGSACCLARFSHVAWCRRLSLAGQSTATHHGVKQPLQVGPGVFDKKKLVESLVQKIHDEGEGAVLILGTNATQELLRALEDVERQVCSPTDDQQGIRAAERLALVPSLGDKVEDRRAIRILLRPIGQLPAAAKSSLRVAKKSVEGQLAGAIAARIREDGATAVHGVGAVALRKSLKATAVAGIYLEGEGVLVGKVLAVLPRFAPAPVEEEQQGLPPEHVLTAFPLYG